MSQVLDLVPIWTLIPGMAVFFYVMLRRLRSRRRHAVRPRARRILPQQDHEYNRADLGRQRNLVGPGGPRALGCVSARLRYHHPSCIFSHSGDAAALIFRGVAFEFRFRDAENKTFWDHAFSCGSAIATFAQGMVLGT
jgi:cytochrome bd ubiquinol oxidase subunit II